MFGQEDHRFAEDTASTKFAGFLADGPLGNRDALGGEVRNDLGRGAALFDSSSNCYHSLPPSSKITPNTIARYTIDQGLNRRGRLLIAGL